MSDSKHTCPTCGRRPSERTGHEAFVESDGYVGTPPRYMVTKKCPNPIHDLADRCEELLGIGKHQILRAEEAEAERDALLEALEVLLARVEEMPNPHADPMRHYYNQMATWKSDARGALDTARGQEAAS